MTARAAKRSASSAEVDADDRQYTSSASPSDHNPGQRLSYTDDSPSNSIDGNGKTLAPPRKRKRRVVSCAECHRRKQKCDRNLPCKACVERKMEASCHYETVAMSRERHHIRVIEAATYDRAIQAGGNIQGKTAGFGYAQSTGNALGFLHKIDAGRFAAPGHDNEELAGYGVEGGGVMSSASLASMVSESPDAIGVFSTPEVVQADAAADQRLYHRPQKQQQNAQANRPSQITPKLAATRQQHLESHRLIHSQHPSFDHQLHSRPQAGDPYGIPERYRALTRELPPKAAIDRLADSYFKSLNWNYYAVDEDVFYKQLGDWTDVAMSPFGTPQSPHQMSPDLRAFPALLFTIIAMGLLILDSKNEDDMAFFEGIKHPNNVTFEDLALDYSETGSSILSLLGKRQMSYTTVLAGFVRSAFLKYVALITEAWHAVGTTIRDAQEVGLHCTSMDPKPRAQTAEAVLENQWEIQSRRRLWMTLISWDVQMGVILGRPITVDLSVRITTPVDCILPKTYAERSTMPVQARSEHDPPTPLSRVIWAYEAIAPLRSILELEKEGPCPRDFARVDELHRQLVDLEARTPAYFRRENPDTRFDDLPGCAWLRSIRATTPQISTFNFMALHRPYIFTRAKSRTEALKACLRMLEVQREHFASLQRQQYKTFSLFFGTFDSLVLMATIYILFPKEHLDLLPEAIQHYRLSVKRFQIMMEHYSLARSALGVLHAIYLRLRKTLGVSFLENEHGLGGVNTPGSSQVDALTLSNIDPSLKDDDAAFQAGSKEIGANGSGGSAGRNDGQSTNDSISNESVASSAGSDVFSNSITTGGSGTPTTDIPRHNSATGTVPASTRSTIGTEQQMTPPEQHSDGKNSIGSGQLVSSSSDSTDQQLPQPVYDGSDSIFPDNFDWSTLPTICPTGDLAYNILMGVSDGSVGVTAAAPWGSAGDVANGFDGPNMNAMNTDNRGASGLSAELDDANAAALAAVQAARTEMAADDISGGMEAMNASVDGTTIPWQFEGDFADNSLWGLLNNYTSV